MGYELHKPDTLKIGRLTQKTFLSSDKSPYPANSVRHESAKS